jgi:hypothetical protein
VSRVRDAVSESSVSKSAVREATAFTLDAAAEITPEIADARRFEERMRHGVRDGSFYALLVAPKHYELACCGICRRFPGRACRLRGPLPRRASAGRREGEGELGRRREHRCPAP